MDEDNDKIDSDPCVIGFKFFVHCEPLHKYIFDLLVGTVIYYCGKNNTFTLSYSEIYSVAPSCKMH